MNPADFYPSKLWAIANDCHRLAPELNIYQIRDKILQKCDKEIRRIEWFWIITNNQAWQDLPPEESQQLAIEIWAIAFEFYSHMNFFELNNDDCWLLKELSHRLLFKKSQKLAEYLIESWYKFPSNRCPNEAKLILEILKIIHNYPANIVEVELLKLTYQYKLLPSQVWAKTDSILPRLDCFKRYFYQLPRLFTKIEKNVPSSTQFFIEILENINDFASENEQAKVVDLCLIQWQVEFFDDKPRLLQWFIKEYHKTSKGSLLSSGAIAKLYQLVGVISYQVFDSIIKSVLRNIRLESHEAKRLRNRKKFWKNYTDSFVGIRVLLPHQSSALFTNEIINQVSILEEDGSEESEVCIFEMKNGILIAEIFRGEGSDLRIFNKQYKDFLFTEPSLSIQKIRALGGERYDHLHLWQTICRKCLYEKYNVFMNQTSNFSLHLREPSRKDQQDRERQLKYWIPKIENLERQARLKYPNL